MNLTNDLGDIYKVFKPTKPNQSGKVVMAPLERCLVATCEPKPIDIVGATISPKTFQKSKEKRLWKVVSELVDNLS